ncbi:hypothetical protein PT974_06545 [Cladobotryum mycophilum]|uniref:Cell wall glucanase n=1 Tax=Cladobotryum mycophilum TaxID=491253 RepID=A0ABR0SLU4_9HYPO
MNADTAIKPSSPQNTPFSSRLSSISGSGLDHLPKLGNFSRILASTRISSPTQISIPIGDNDGAALKEPRPVLNADKCTRLGDFKRVFNELQSPVSSKHTSPVASPVQTCSSIEHQASIKSSGDIRASRSPPLLVRSNTTQSIGDVKPKSSTKATISILKRPSTPQRVKEDTSPSDTDSNSESDRVFEVDAAVLTPASTPPSLEDKIKSSQTSAPRRRLSTNTSGKTRRRSKSETGILLAYHVGKDGSPINIYEKLQTREQKHDALTMDLIPHRTLDTIMAKKYPKVASHGAHIFIDMSNIDIGFQNALRTRYKLADNAHFSPLPHLNLKFLTEALVRNRTTVTRTVGCSIVPGRPEPRYIQELQKLGYHVDLRERKRVQDAKPASTHIRYVEDLVDETLQTRIAESVMEYFQEQGTIILATGDAKPAQYSDGFFTYAERALRMGWNIELISWKSSLSSTWTSRKWKAQWGDRFRIIELDDFLDNLLACYL